MLAMGLEPRPLVCEEDALLTGPQPTSVPIDGHLEGIREPEVYISWFPTVVL